MAAVDPSETFVAAARERTRESTCSARRPKRCRIRIASSMQRLHSSSFTSCPTPGWNTGDGAGDSPGRRRRSLRRDDAGERSPLAPFWQAAHELDIGVLDESGLAGARQGHLVELFEAAGLREVEQSELVARIEYASVDDWLEPFSLGVGPAGAAYAGLDRSSGQTGRAVPESRRAAAVRARKRRLGRARRRLVKERDNPLGAVPIAILIERQWAFDLDVDALSRRQCLVAVHVDRGEVHPDVLWHVG